MPAKLKCLRCGYEWEPRVANPKRCARCFRPDWNRKPGERWPGGRAAAVEKGEAHDD